MQHGRENELIKNMNLSIITINKNNADGLHITIESVIAQTYNDFEFIVIDGASTDSSIQLLRNLDTRDRRNVSWISEPDRGVFHAMNKGIQQAKGDYLLFLNSGDFLVDNHVLQNVFCKCRFSEDILCGSCRITQNGTTIHITNPPKFFKFSDFYKTSIAHQSTFIKRTLFDKYGLYREDLKLMSDWEFWIRTIILGKVTTTNIDVLISDYNLNGISSDTNNQLLKDMEINQVFTDLNLQKIVIDYQQWESERNEMKILSWVKSKTILYYPLCWLYRIAVRMKKNKHNNYASR